MNFAIEHINVTICINNVANCRTIQQIVYDNFFVHKYLNWIVK